jgi:hypothetical protein
METKFSFFEVSMIRKLMSCKSDEDIAEILERSVPDVKEKIHELTGGNSPFQESQLQKKRQAERRAEELRLKRQEKQARKDVEKKRTTSSAIISRSTADRIQANKRRNEPKFVTKVVELSQLVAVRIDHKTTIFIKPGEDPEGAKEKYFERLHACKSRMMNAAGAAWTPVAKFKT